MLPLWIFLFFASLGFYLFVLRKPRKDDITRDILSIGETQFGKEVNNLIREELKRKEKRNFIEKLNDELVQTQTGITLPVYLLILAASVAGIFMVTNFILGVPLVSILFSMLGVFIPKAVVNFLRKKNMDFFDLQLVPVLRRMSSLLRSGASLKQALQDVSSSVSVPVKLRKEFRKVLQDIEAGDELEPALFRMYERIGSGSLLFLAVTVDILRKQGANLPEVFDTISQNISTKNISERKVRSTLAQLRASSNLLSLLPFVIGGTLTLMNPGYFDPLFQSMGGRILLFTILLMMVTGFFVFKKLSKVE